ncbi:MAG: D-alanine--D-alanine ligase [Halofilum sp. (in: g-proteobacteria)]
MSAANTYPQEPALADPARLGHVAVVYGGWSAEREISLKSGRAVLAGLERAGVDAVGVDADRDILRVLADGGFDRVFLVLHGRGGEDGQIQGGLEILGLPYTGSGVLGSALAMDKLRSKRFWAGAGFPTPPWQALAGREDAAKAVEALGLPLMIKPALEGSSIGMTKLSAREGAAEAWDQAAQFGPVLAERFIDGSEVTVSLLGDRALPPIRLETPRDFYDYAAKYEAGTTQYHLPSGLEAAIEARCRKLALEAFAALGGAGWGRVDLMLDGDGEPWLIEANTAPGMTEHSLVPKSAAHDGIGFDELVVRVLAQTLEYAEGGA